MKRMMMIGTVIMMIVFVSILIVKGDEYSNVAKIVAIEENNEVVFEDGTGNIYSFFGNGFEVGDVVKVVYRANGTDEDRTDDSIVSVRVIDENSLSSVEKFELRNIK